MLIQKHGKELVVTSEVDVLQGVIASIDGEKDPRCLMLSFQLAQQAIRIYEQAAPRVRHASSSLHVTHHTLLHAAQLLVVLLCLLQRLCMGGA